MVTGKAGGTINMCGYLFVVMGAPILRYIFDKTRNSNMSIND